MNRLITLGLSLGAALSFSVLTQAQTLDRAGNGGDPLEMRFHMVAKNLKKWIENGDLSFIQFPEGVSESQYRTKMLETLSDYNVTFIRKPVSLLGHEKVCRNFRDEYDRPQVLCHAESFYDFLAPGQEAELANIYPLVHHEIAGLAGFEINDDGARSNYDISIQVYMNLPSIVDSATGSIRVAERYHVREISNDLDLSPSYGSDQTIHDVIWGGVSPSDGGDLTEITARFPTLAERIDLLSSVASVTETDMGALRLYDLAGNVLMVLMEGENGWEAMDHPDFADHITLMQSEYSQSVDSELSFAMSECRDLDPTLEREQTQRRNPEQPPHFEQEMEQEKEKPLYKPAKELVHECAAVTVNLQTRMETEQKHQSPADAPWRSDSGRAYEKEQVQEQEQAKEIPDYALEKEQAYEPRQEQAKEPL